MLIGIAAGLIYFKVFSKQNTVQQSQINPEKDKQAIDSLERFAISLEIYRNDTGSYPANIQELRNANYIKGETGSGYTYTSDCKTYTVSVKLSDNTEYKLSK